MSRIQILPIKSVHQLVFFNCIPMNCIHIRLTYSLYSRKRFCIWNSRAWYYRLQPTTQLLAFKKFKSKTKWPFVRYKRKAYVGRRVSSNVSSICIALTIADSFLSLWNIFDRSCSIISCLWKQIINQVLIVTSFTNNNFREKGHGTGETNIIQEFTVTYACLFHLTVFSFNTFIKVGKWSCL